MLGSLHGALERAGLDAVEEAAVDAAAASLLALMDVDGTGHVALDDYRRIVRDHPEELRRAGLGVPTRRRRSTAAAAGASRRASVAAHLGGGAGADVRRKALALRRLRRRGLAVAFGHARWELVVLLMIAVRLALEGSTTARSARGPVAAAPPRRGGGGARGAGWQCCGRRPRRRRRGRGRPERAAAARAHEWRRVLRRALARRVLGLRRACFGISEVAFMRSLGPEQVLGEMLLGTLGSLAELLSDGKSGSFFYFSNDGRYLIKTVPLRELTALLELLPDYTRHMRAHPHSRCCRDSAARSRSASRAPARRTLWR